MNLTCKQCGGEMRKRTISGGGGCFWFLIGITLFFAGIGLCLSGGGAIIGIPLALAGLF